MIDDDEKYVDLFFGGGRRVLLRDLIFFYPALNKRIWYRFFLLAKRWEGDCF